MAKELGAVFVKYASDILGDTDLGLTGPEIARLFAAYGIESGIEVPHPIYPFEKDLPNKRTALYENLMAFPEALRYRIIKDLTEHRRIVDRNPDGAEKLRLTLIGSYGHLANEAFEPEVDRELVERTRHWLGPFPEVLRLYDQAVQNHANGLFLRHVLDDLRLALELLLKGLFANEKSLEKQIPVLGKCLKENGGSAELSNMFVTLVDYYTKYQNSYVKHDDAVIEEEVEFMFELTSSFMKHIVRLSYRGAA